MRLSTLRRTRPDIDPVQGVERRGGAGPRAAVRGRVGVIPDAPKGDPP